MTILKQLYMYRLGFYTLAEDPNFPKAELFVVMASLNKAIADIEAIKFTLCKRCKKLPEGKLPTDCIFWEDADFDKTSKVLPCLELEAE